MVARKLGFALCCLLLLPSCAGSGGSSNDPSVKQWQQDSKKAIKEGTPEAEADLRETLARQGARLNEGAAKHAAQAELSDDVILGTKAFHDALKPATFEAHIALLRKYDVVPTLRPFADRKRGKFFEPASKADKDRLQKLWNKKQLLEDLRAALQTTEGIGMYLVAEQDGTTKLNWSAELFALQIAAEVVAFEQTFETEVGDETLDEITKVLATRDQTRLLMATHSAMLAAFDGVASGGDPAAVGQLAAASKAHIADKPAVSREDARKFVSEIGDNSLDVAASLEAMMRAAAGDEEYERHYQRELVRTLTQVENAQAKASMYDMVDDQAKQAKLVEVQQLAKTAQERLKARAIELGMDKAEKFLGALPFGSQIVAGLRAIRELRNGNPRGALMAAIDAAPPGPIQEGMRSASKIGFLVADVAKDRKKRRK